MIGEREYKVVLRREKEGGYSVFVPGLPGTFTQGETREEALAMAREAIELMLEEYLEEGEEVPGDCEFLIETVRVDVDSIKSAA